MHSALVKFRNISLINVHAPTKKTAQSEKDAFYEGIKRTLKACPRYDIKIILPDLNSQVRTDVFKRYIGSHTLKKNTNDDGLRIIQLAVSRGMLVENTWFAQKAVHKQPWTTGNGTTQTLLSLDDCHRGANIVSDYYLVGILLRARIRTWPRNPTDNQVNTTLRCTSYEGRGSMISDRMGILELYVEYFDEPLNKQNIGESRQLKTTDKCYHQ